MRLFLAISVVLFTLSRQSPVPAPTPSKSSNEQQQIGSNKAGKTTDDQTNSQQSPPPAKNLPNSPPCCAQSAYPAGDTSNKTTKDWIVIFTAVLAGVAVFQLGAMVAQFVAMHKQAHYMRRGLFVAVRSARAAKKAATAALLTAKSGINSERAWVDVELFRDAGYSFIFRAENFGRTPAYKVELTFESRHFTTAADMVRHSNFEPFYKLIGSSKVENVRYFDMPKELGHDVWMEIIQGKRQLIFEGVLTYRSVLVETGQYSSKFVYRYDARRSNFERVAHYTEYT